MEIWIAVAFFAGGALGFLVGRASGRRSSGGRSGGGNRDRLPR